MGVFEVIPLILISVVGGMVIGAWIMYKGL